VGSARGVRAAHPRYTSKCGGEPVGDGASLIVDGIAIGLGCVVPVQTELGVESDQH
jgi:hypothetical protein